MRLYKVVCATCGKLFLRIASRINEAKKFKWKSYCSSACQFEQKNKQRIFRCSNPSCNKTFKRTVNKAYTPQVYCSRSCAVTINNSKFPKRIARTGNCGICKKQFKGTKQYCSKQCKWKAQIINQETLTHWIKSFYLKNKRVPVKRECPHYRSIRNVFGTWNKAVQASGLHPNPVLFAERQLANDGHSCGSIAEKLIDNWLAEHNISHERNVSYPDGKHTADFFVNGIFIEFFGLIGELKEYDAHIQIKEKLARKHHMPLLKIYPKDMYPLTKLDGVLSNALSVPKN